MRYKDGMTRSQKSDDMLTPDRTARKQAAE